MTPLVSILIPAFNAESWVAETLNSALAQTWPQKEVILVDDGSADRTLEIARSFESRGVQVFAQDNQGASSARNRVWRESRGEWLQFLDADDLLHPEKVSSQMGLACNLGPGFAYCARWTRFTRTIADADFTPQPLCCDADPVSWITAKLRDNLMMHPAAWLVSRPLAERAGPWDPTLTLDDDGEFFSRVVMASDGIRHCEAALSYYRSNLCGALSSRNSKSAWFSAFRSLQLTSKHLLERASDVTTRSAVANAYQRLAYSIYPDEPQLVRECEVAADSLGGSLVRPGGGWIFAFVARTLGWRTACRMRRWRGRWRV